MKLNRAPKAEFQKRELVEAWVVVWERLVDVGIRVRNPGLAEKSGQDLKVANSLCK
jgi:hypothetical protein